MECETEPRCPDCDVYLIYMRRTNGVAIYACSRCNYQHYVVVA